MSSLNVCVHAVCLRSLQMALWATPRCLWRSVNTTVRDSEQRGVENPFTFSPFTIEADHEALSKFDPKKPAGPDNVEPFFLKIAADCIAPPLTSLSNLSLSTNTIPKIWKSAYVLPLLKGGEATLLNNYRPISKLSVLAKVLRDNLYCAFWVWCTLEI